MATNVQLCTTVDLVLSEASCVTVAEVLRCRETNTTLRLKQDISGVRTTCADLQTPPAANQAQQITRRDATFQTGPGRASPAAAPIRLQDLPLAASLVHGASTSCTPAMLAEIGAHVGVAQRLVSRTIAQLRSSANLTTALTQHFGPFGPSNRARIAANYGVILSELDVTWHGPLHNADSYARFALAAGVMLLQLQPSHGTESIHERIAEEYRRAHGPPPRGDDEAGGRVGPSDSEIIYRALSYPVSLSGLSSMSPWELVVLASERLIQPASASTRAYGDYRRTRRVARYLHDRFHLSFDYKHDTRTPGTEPLAPQLGVIDANLGQLLSTYTVRALVSGPGGHRRALHSPASTSRLRIGSNNWQANSVRPPAMNLAISRSCISQLPGPAHLRRLTTYSCFPRIDRAEAQ